MEKFSTLISREQPKKELADFLPKKTESLSYKNSYSLYVIPMFMDTQEMMIVSHTPKSWEKKEGQKWLSFLSGEFIDSEFDMKKIKAILLDYGITLKTTVKYRLTKKFFKSTEGSGIVQGVILYLGYWDFDENEINEQEQNYSLFRLRQSAINEIVFDDVNNYLMKQAILEQTSTVNEVLI